MTVEQLLRLSERMRLDLNEWTAAGGTRDPKGRIVYVELWRLCDSLLAQAVQQSCAPLTVAEGLRNV